MTKRTGVLTGLFSLVGPFVVGAGCAGSAQRPERVGTKGQIVINADNLEDARSLAEFYKDREKQIAALVPAGTVIAFAGTLDPKHAPDGWLVCNNETFDPSVYPKLAALLQPGADGHYRVPDLRGVFLRGLDMGRGLDKDGAKRQVGQQQEYATAQPHAKFSAKNSGSHSHGFSGVNIGSGNWQSGGSDKPGAKVTGADKTTGAAGGHTHEIEGGDSETRPVNVGVYYLIRAK